MGICIQHDAHIIRPSPRIYVAKNTHLLPLEQLKRPITKVHITLLLLLDLQFPLLFTFSLRACVRYLKTSYEFLLLLFELFLIELN